MLKLKILVNLTVLDWKKKAGLARFHKYFFDMIQEEEVVVPPNLPDLIKKVLINSALKNLSDIHYFNRIMLQI